MTAEERQHKIDYEIIVDCYEDYEVNMGWYYHFEENMAFPFKAKVKIKKKGGLESVETLEVVSVASEEDKDLRLGAVVPNTDFIVGIRVSDIISVDTSETNKELLNDWLFWMDLELL